MPLVVPIPTPPSRRRATDPEIQSVPHLTLRVRLHVGVQIPY